MKDIAVKAEDYDLAKQLKQKIEVLRRAPRVPAPTPEPAGAHRRSNMCSLSSAGEKA
jgi:hypothetical protein